MATVLFFEVKKSLRKRQRSLELLGEPPRYSLRFWGLDPLGFILGSRNVVGQGELLTIIFRFLKDRNICHSNKRTVDHHWPICLAGPRVGYDSSSHFEDFMSLNLQIWPWVVQNQLGPSDQNSDAEFHRENRTWPRLRKAIAALPPHETWPKFAGFFPHWGRFDWEWWSLHCQVWSLDG